jgi:hypothetical protein
VLSIDDPMFAPSATPPFAPGASPFRQKGNAYIGDRPWLDHAVRGGYDAAVAAIADPAARAFLAQRFLASEWYDAYPGALLELTAAKLRGVPFAKHRREAGAFHARQTVRGIYAALLAFVSNESVALWGPRIAALYFDFGKTTSRVIGPNAVASSRVGIPADLVQWSAHAIAGFAETAVELAGGRDVRCALTGVKEERRAGERAGYRIDLTIEWR